jgi:hypothetical protein
MDAVTYPDEHVIEFMNEHIVPVRVNISSEPLPQQFNVQWTPTLVLLDTEQKEHHRIVGWLATEELIASLLLGIGKSQLDHGELSTAATTLDRLLADYAATDAAPEAQYLRGVVAFKETGDLQALKEMREQLVAKYPASEWTKRASVYQAA